MKKILIFIITFLFLLNNINAKTDIVINDLFINNGEITPKFDKYNNYYSVTVDKDTKNLEFSYNFDNNKYEVKIDNNSNLVQNKLVYMTISDKETNEKNTYIFKVFINNEDSEIPVFSENNTTTDKTAKNKHKNYAPLIGTICFLLIIIIFKIMFL